MNDHLSRKELFIRFTASVFRKLLSIYAFSYFPFGFEGMMWDLIVSAPDQCLSFYLNFSAYIKHFKFWSKWMEIKTMNLIFLMFVKV